ncbi:helix-turn-helix domain-containing protein [Flavobacterium sp. ARAG 55.4]|uniref:helix-turn-helix domain-containing protein n=1 Tax=Flavobacterium sp. ARAG 55.4 TaxID=3451357 RepID=UPI003F480BB2
MNNSKHLGLKILEARKNINLSQAKLANIIAISPQAIGKWERGESMPDIIMLDKLAKVFDVDLNYFSNESNSGSHKVDLQQNSNKLLSNDSGTHSNNDYSSNWDMSSGDWVDADFSDLKNLKDKFSNSNMKRCKFIGSELSGLLLRGNNIDGCDFTDSEIKSSQIQNSQLINNEFQNCVLQGSEFSQNHIKNCNFSNANLSKVKLISGTFINIEVIKTVWNQTSFIKMYFENIVFEGNIDNCSFDNCRFKKVTFQNAVLTNTFYKGRKLKGVKFINCKADKMTYEFLKNAKADLKEVTLLSYKQL